VHVRFTGWTFFTDALRRVPLWIFQESLQTTGTAEIEPLALIFRAVFGDFGNHIHVANWIFYFYYYLRNHKFLLSGMSVEQLGQFFVGFERLLFISGAERSRCAVLQMIRK
jgi:hypothetical protein